MPPVGFYATILASERPQTHVLDRSEQLLHQCKYINDCLMFRNVMQIKRDVFLAQFTMQQ